MSSVLSLVWPSLMTAFVSGLHMIPQDIHLQAAR
jgi:hypothetical protein